MVIMKVSQFTDISSHTVAPFLRFLMLTFCFFSLSFYLAACVFEHLLLRVIEITEELIVSVGLKRTQRNGESSFDNIVYHVIIVSTLLRELFYI